MTNGLEKAKKMTELNVTEDVRGFLFAILGADSWIEAGAIWNGNPDQRKAAHAALSTAREGVAKTDKRITELGAALIEAEQALTAAEERDDKARFRANSPRMDSEVIHLRTSAIRHARTALQSIDTGGGGA